MTVKKNDPRFLCALEEMTLWLADNAKRTASQQLERDQDAGVAKLTPEQKRKLDLG